MVVFTWQIYKSKVIIKVKTKFIIQTQPVLEVLFIWHGGETLLCDISFYKKSLAY